MLEQEEINAVSAPGKARVDLVSWLATVMPYRTTSKNIFNALSMPMSICRTTSLGSTYSIPFLTQMPGNAFSIE